MDELSGNSGRVEVVFARGWLSAWEAARLERGSGLLAETEAGEPAELCFNGRWLARGELVVFADSSAADSSAGEELAAFRVTGLEKGAREAPERGGGDFLAELLPFELCLGGAAYSLDRLREAGVGSILSLDAPIASGSPVLLRIAGAPAGRGKAAVAGERFALILDELAPPLSSAREPLYSGSFLEPEAAKARLKPYDFARPDRFTARSLEALASIHRRAAEAAAALCPELSGLRVGRVDQLSWGEWLEAEGGRKGPLFLSTMERPRRPYEVGEAKESGRRGMPFVQPERARFRQPPEIGEEIGFWLEAEETRLGDRLVLIAPAGFEGLPDPGLILEALRAGWKTVADSRFAQAALLAEPPVMEASTRLKSFSGAERGLLRGEMVVLVRLEAGARSLDVLYSSRAIEAFAATLDRYGRYAPDR